MAIIDAREKKKQEIFKTWKTQYDRYKNAKDALKRGSGFYSHLKQSMEELKEKVVQFVNRRADERVALVKKIEDEFAEQGQRAIREQLEKLNTGPPSQAAYPSQPTSQVHHHTPAPPPIQTAPQHYPPSNIPPVSEQTYLNSRQGSQSPASGGYTSQGAFSPGMRQDESFYLTPSMPPGVQSLSAYQPLAPPPPSPLLAQMASNQPLDTAPIMLPQSYAKEASAGQQQYSSYTGQQGMYSILISDLFIEQNHLSRTRVLLSKLTMIRHTDQRV